MFFRLCTQKNPLFVPSAHFGSVFDSLCKWGIPDENKVVATHNFEMFEFTRTRVSVLK